LLDLYITFPLVDETFVSVGVCDIDTVLL